MDTNVFISALSSKTGSNRQVLRACLEKRVSPVIGSALFHEMEDLMKRSAFLKRCPLSVDEQNKIFAAYLSSCEWVNIHFLWRPNLKDEADNHLIELAIAGNAQVLITNNIKDLKSGELIFPSLKIVTPSKFLRQLL